MTKAREIAELGQNLSVDASGNIDVNGSVTANTVSVDSDLTVGGTVDGRDVAADGTKLDGIEASADVTDTANVTAAGALMDSELTDIAAIKALDQGVATTDDPTFTNTQLAEIAATISDTAVDVFVYDTSKDSDGGAWRKRTQHTSWYNETLNTATRGSRKEFPAVAVIVAESDTVTIYDGDDPDLPMWMVFNSTSWNIGIPIAFDGSQSLCALNGMLVVGDRAAAAGGISRIRFIEDYAQLLSGSGWAYTFEKILISGRNTQISNVYAPYPADPQSLVNYAVNDVAMTVLPNAPIDAATGLPVPTIAVATSGGLSVIRDDGTVVDKISTNSSVYNKVWDVAFTEDNDITFYFDRGYNQRNMLAVWKIPTSDYASYDFNGGNIWTSSPSSYPSGIGGSNNNTSPHYSSITTSQGKIAAGKTLGLTVFDVASTLGQSATNYTTSTYNTGWMNGDIKLATLSDTDDTDVTGSELVTNGTFDSDTSGWTVTGNGTFTASGGVATLTDPSPYSTVVETTITTVVGKTYTLSYTTSGSREAYAELRVSDSTIANTQGFTGSRTGTFSVTFNATSTSTTVRISDGSGVSKSNVVVDNISVRLAEEDRSVNGNGLQVFGTVTKNPVATGADLVAYSNFASNRYLEQPYNSDFDFGTGDFAFIWWMSSGAANADKIVWNLGDYNGSNGLGCLHLNSSGSGDSLNLHFEGSDVNSTVYIEGHESAGWICIAMVRRGGTLEGYKNGVLQGTSSTATGSFSLASETIQTLNIGAGYSSGSVFSGAYSGDLALFRASATAPSPEQIKKIYEDEKVLFQENAQATLYGSSDAVTALAYDDSTELLHVGTSAGRSDFQGLRRVNNTTNAVGAAISASNGLVADE